MQHWSKYSKGKNKWRIAGFTILFGLVVLMIAGFVMEHKRPDITRGEFALEIKSQLTNGELVNIDNKNKRVYYTLDASEPGLHDQYFDKPTSTLELSFFNAFREFISSKPTSPMWKNPLGLSDRGLIVKYRIKNPDNSLSKTQTLSFIPDPCADKNPRLPVVSLITAYENLFHHHRGMFIMGREYYRTLNFEDERLSLPSWYKYWELPANYHNRGPEWLREGHLNFFNSRGELILDQAINFKLKGSASRALPQKSLVIDFKGELMGTPLFEEFTEGEKYWRILLRNSGGDFIHTMLRDAFFQRLLDDTNILRQNYQPVIVYINGEYWGIQNLRQHLDELELGNRLKKPGSRIELIELTNAARKKQKEPNKWDQFYAELESEKDDSVYLETFRQNVDLNAFIDYVILQCYSTNTDWPNNNVRVYQNTDSLKKWMFLLYDTDYGFGGAEIADSYKINMHEQIMGNNSTIADIYRRLIQIEEFNKNYTKRYLELLDGSLNSKRLTTEWERYVKRIEPYITEHIKRWRMPVDKADWEKRTQIVTEFIELRREYALLEIEQIKEAI